VDTQFDIRDLRYRNEPDIGTSYIGLKGLESDIMSDIGLNVLPISYIRHLTGAAEQDSYDRASRTGHPEQDTQTGQAGQNRLKEHLRLGISDCLILV
jgi:hypothetical protein